MSEFFRLIGAIVVMTVACVLVALVIVYMASSIGWIPGSCRV